MNVNRASVLVVDDDAMNRMLLRRSLERQGHAVSVAVDGREALELARSASFDIVLLDIVMPEMDGFELLERLQADEALRQLSVIMISAVTKCLPRPCVRARGTRSARPVRKQATSSRLSAPRPWMNKA